MTEGILQKKESDLTKIYADVAQILEWSDNCAFACPLGQQYQNYLRLFEEYSNQVDQIKKLQEEIGWLKKELKAVIKSK